MTAEKAKWYRHELIGKSAKIMYNGRLFEGKIVDETKETITLLHDKKRKKLIKNSLTIDALDGAAMMIEGRAINLRPHDRIKLR